MNIHNVAVDRFFSNVLDMPSPNEVQRKYFEILFKSWSERYQHIFDMRFGKGMTYQLCGEYFNVSRQRIEQICRNMIEQCQSYPTVKKLELGEARFLREEVRRTRSIDRKRVVRVIKRFNLNNDADIRKLHKVLRLDAKHKGYMLETKPIPDSAQNEKVVNMEITSGSLSRLLNSVGGSGNKVETVYNLMEIICSEARWFEKYPKLGKTSICDIYSYLNSRGYLTNTECVYLKALL